MYYLDIKTYIESVRDIIYSMITSFENHLMKDYGFQKASLDLDLFDEIQLEAEEMVLHKLECLETEQPSIYFNVLGAMLLDYYSYHIGCIDDSLDDENLKNREYRSDSFVTPPQKLFMSVDSILKDPILVKMRQHYPLSEFSDFLKEHAECFFDLLENAKRCYNNDLGVGSFFLRNSPFTGNHQDIFKFYNSFEEMELSYPQNLENLSHSALIERETVRQYLDCDDELLRDEYLNELIERYHSVSILPSNALDFLDCFIFMQTVIKTNYYWLKGFSLLDEDYLSSFEDIIFTDVDRSFLNQIELSNDYNQFIHTVISDDTLLVYHLQRYFGFVDNSFHEIRADLKQLNDKKSYMKKLNIFK